MNKDKLSHLLSLTNQLSSDELEYLKTCIDDKINNRTTAALKNIPTTHISNTRIGRRSGQPIIGPTPYSDDTYTLSGQQSTPNTVSTYYNPHEYGSKQNLLPSIWREHYLPESGIQRHINNFGTPTSAGERQTDRFVPLYFNPQDANHIVWSDNMPRGGRPTRVDRLQLN